MEVAKELGSAVRVVSMPCFERFERQDDAYKAEVLPARVARRVAIEAGVSGLWYRYASKVIGTDDFGFSAPGGAVMDAFGISAENLLVVAEAMLREGREARAKAGAKPSAVLSTLDCETVDSLPGVFGGELRSGTLETLPGVSDDDSSAADSVSESPGSGRNYRNSD